MGKAKGKGTGSSIGKIFVIILVLLLLLSIAGVTVYFIYKDKGVIFYVSYDGKKYMANTESGNIYLPPSDDAYYFKVKSLTGKDVDYDVKVTSSSENNFSFVVGNEYWKFYDSDETKNDYTDFFNLEKQSGGLNLNVAKGFTVTGAVAEQFGGEIELLSELSADKEYFVITVTFDESSVNLYFSTGYMLYLDTPQIVF